MTALLHQQQENFKIVFDLTMVQQTDRCRALQTQLFKVCQSLLVITDKNDILRYSADKKKRYLRAFNSYLRKSYPRLKKRRGF